MKLDKKTLLKGLGVLVALVAYGYGCYKLGSTYGYEKGSAETCKNFIENLTIKEEIIEEEEVDE